MTNRSDETTPRPSLVVDIRLRPHDSGGRQWPIFSGYRPLFKLQKELTIGLSELTIPDGASIEPGGSGRAIVVMSPEVRKIVLENVDVGDTMQMYEGNRVVGEAKLVSFLD
jgi:translation elongation factor EF-Tu-like GTPase